MTKEDLEIVANLVTKVRNGTRVTIHDNEGNLVSFALEDVVNIRQDTLRSAITYIYIAKTSGCYTKLDYKNFSDSINCTKITVFGSVEKWNKLLKFNNVNVLNCD